VVTETDIRYALERATDDISSPPDLLERVRAGGRRRVVRRRTVLAGGLAVAAAGVTVPLAGRRNDGPARPATRGDLAGDQDFLARARQAWVDQFGGNRPDVWWAGTTPAGPVALVAQFDPADRSDRSDGEPRDQLGFVAQDGDRLVAPPVVEVVPAGTVVPIALLTGRNRDVLVVAGADRATVSFSPDYSFDHRGQVLRSFTPLRPGPDGVVVRPVSPQGERAVQIGLRQGPEGRVSLIDVGEQRQPPPMLPSPEQLDRRLPGWEQAWPGPAEADLGVWDPENRDGYFDAFGYHTWAGPQSWRILGALPDGRRLLVRTIVQDSSARVYWVVGRPGDQPQIGYLGPAVPPVSTERLDPVAGPLHILHARLPGRLGVMVAAQRAALRYRVRTGAWLPVNGDAALLPDATTAIEVTPRRGRAVTIGLP
jgi:hypothetical protein